MLNAIQVGSGIGIPESLSCGSPGFRRRRKNPSVKGGVLTTIPARTSLISPTLWQFKADLKGYQANRQTYLSNRGFVFLRDLFVDNDYCQDYHISGILFPKATVL